MTKTEKALEFHKKGFNCAQSVVLPFCEELGLDPETVSKGMEGFGAGMGGFDMTCGALSGAVYIAGMLHSDGNMEHPASKRGTYSVCKKLCADFKEKCGSGICRQIKGLDTGKLLISCDECIACGVSLVENMLK